jgi:cell division protein FtsL
MKRGDAWMLGLLGVAVTCSAVGVVYAKYLSRSEFVDLQALNGERQHLEVQWGRLRIEEAALTAQPRVEELARRRLDMHIPYPSEVRVIGGDLHGADGK